MAMGNPNWKPGQSGNPAGGNFKQKKFLAALERVIAQDDGKGLRDAAEKVYELAAKGEEWAIQFLADRLDGKPTQQLDMRVTRPTKELSDDELANIAAGSSEGTPAAPASEESPTQLH
jgi:cytochrome c553